MNVLIITIFGRFIASIYAESYIAYYNQNTKEFKIKIDHEIDRSKVPSYIRIYQNATAGKSLLYEVDASKNNSNITYANKTLTVPTPDFPEGNINTGYFITLDDNVLSSIQSTMISSAMTTDSATTATSDSSNNSRISTTESSTTLLTYPTGELSPTRSAQLGMGLGITLIGVLLIGEIIYFKYFYRGSLQTDNYLA